MVIKKRISYFKIGTVATQTSSTGFKLPYFLDYKTEFFSFQNNLKDLDPSCKMDLIFGIF